MGKSKRTRIDKLLVEQGHIESRERAQRLILAGQVLADERVIDSPILGAKGNKEFLACLR